MEPPLRSINLASSEAAMSGTSGGEGGGAKKASGDAGGPAKAVQVLETLRAMRQLVTFCPGELPEAFANHFTRGQIAEMAARLEACDGGR